MGMLMTHFSAISCAKHRELYYTVNVQLGTTAVISLTREKWPQPYPPSCNLWYLCFCLAWRRDKQLRMGEMGTWKCKWGPLLLQIRNLSYHTIHWNAFQMHRRIEYYKKKNQTIGGGKAWIFIRPLGRKSWLNSEASEKITKTEMDRIDCRKI